MNEQFSRLAIDRSDVLSMNQTNLWTVVQTVKELKDKKVELSDRYSKTADENTTTRVHKLDIPTLDGDILNS